RFHYEMPPSPPRLAPALPALHSNATAAGLMTNPGCPGNASAGSKQQEKPRPMLQSPTVTGLLMTLLWAQLAARCSHLHRDRQPAAALVARQQPAAESEPSEIVACTRSRETLFVKEICIGCGPDRICTRRFRPAFFGLLASTSIAVFVIVSLVLATLVKRRRLQAKQFARPAASSRQLSSSAAMRLLRTARPQSRELLSKFFVQTASTRDRQICGRMTRKRVKKLRQLSLPLSQPVLTISL
uniref:Toxoplasma gondii family B protein n=1 Tax=Macrostomum lignano TaxID=282301 RepID=A0A1I8FA02_9PLAT